jgi:hypothetical protein
MGTFVNLLLTVLAGAVMGGGIVGVIFLSMRVENMKLPKLLRVLLTVLIYFLGVSLLLGIIFLTTAFILEPAGANFILYFIPLLFSFLFALIYPIVD